MAASAGNTPTQFSRLLRQSRIASFDPSIPQVYTSPPAYASRGDWGLKRPLRSNTGSTNPGSSSTTGSNALGALRYLEVSELDTPQGQTTWKEREKETLFLKRWSEAGVRVHNVRPEHAAAVARPGSCGPRPHTTFLPSTQRHFPSQITDPITRPNAKDTAQVEANDKNADSEFVEKWRVMMKRHATRGAADPTYAGLDYLGEQAPSTAFGLDAENFTLRPQMIQNYNAMSERDFERFVSQIRASRSQWKSFFRLIEQNRLSNKSRKRQQEQQTGVSAHKVPSNHLDMLEQSRDMDATRDAFRMLQDQTVKATTKPSNERLPGASQPTTLHPHAGLQYSQPDPIFPYLFAEPQPGRVMHEFSTKTDRENSKHTKKIADARSVAIGGRVAFLYAPLRYLAPPTIDWSRQEPKKGTALFRVVSAWRTGMLPVGEGMHRDFVATREDLGYVRSQVELVSSDVSAPRTSLPVPIGSPDYVGKKAEDPDKPTRHSLSGSSSSSSSSSGGDRADSLLIGEKRRQEWRRRLNRGRSKVSGEADGSSSASNKDETQKMFANLDSLVGDQSKK